MSASITPEQFDFLAARAGISLTPEQRDEIMGVYPHLAAMLERIRTPARGREAEPAHIFIPGEGVKA